MIVQNKTLWIITELFPPDETSTSYILGEIANAFSKEYHVFVICGPEVYDPRKHLETDHPLTINSSIKLLRVSGLEVDKNTIIGKVKSYIRMSNRLYRLAKRNIKVGDKVLLVTNPAPLVVLISKLRRRRSFELNILVHDIFPENTIPAGLYIPSGTYRVLKFIFDRSYSCADRLIAIGRDMADVLGRKVKQRVPIVIVENWAEIDSIKPIPFPGEPIKLEYAGNIGRVQGLDRLVRDLPRGIELHFYGTGAIEQSLKEMEIPGVFFHGPYLRSQQQEVIGSCHVSIVTLAEGMYGLGVPSKAYNILAAGRPIVYFGPENGEIGLMIKEHNIGYIGWPFHWDINELKEMGARARALAESSYSKQVILNKLFKALS